MNNKPFYKSGKFWLIIVIAILVVSVLNPGMRKAFKDGLNDKLNSGSIVVNNYMKS